MDASWVLTVGFLVMLVLGVPIVFAIGISSVIALWMLDIDLVVLAQRLIAGTHSFPLLAIPGFILGRRPHEPRRSEHTAHADRGPHGAPRARRSGHGQCAVFHVFRLPLRIGSGHHRHCRLDHDPGDGKARLHQALRHFPRRQRGTPGSNYPAFHTVHCLGRHRRAVHNAPVSVRDRSRRHRRQLLHGGLLFPGQTPGHREAAQGHLSPVPQSAERRQMGASGPCDHIGRNLRRRVHPHGSFRGGGSLRSHSGPLHLQGPPMERPVRPGAQVPSHDGRGHVHHCRGQRFRLAFGLRAGARQDRRADSIRIRQQNRDPAAVERHPPDHRRPLWTIWRP